VAHDTGRLRGLFIYRDVRNNMQVSNESFYTRSFSDNETDTAAQFLATVARLLRCPANMQSSSGSNPYNELEGLSGIEASIVKRNGLDGSGFEPRWGAKFSLSVQTGPKAHPAPCTIGNGSFLGVKRPQQRGADHHPHSIADIVYGWTSPLCPHGMLEGDLYLYNLKCVDEYSLSV